MTHTRYKTFEYTCPLEHEHKIRVSFTFDNKEFVISKERVSTQEEINDNIAEIHELLEENTCYECKGIVAIGDLAGFTCDAACSINVERPIHKSCWKDWMNDEDDYVDLKEHLDWLDLLPDPEYDKLALCFVFAGYPKKGLETWEGWNEFDKEMINKFKVEYQKDWENT